MTRVSTAQYTALDSQTTPGCQNEVIGCKSRDCLRHSRPSHPGPQKARAAQPPETPEIRRMNNAADSGGRQPSMEEHEDKALLQEEAKEKVEVEQEGEVTPNDPPTADPPDPPVTYETERLLYAVNENPGHFVNISVAMQHLLSSLGSALVISFVLSDLMCASSSDSLRAVLFSTTLCMSGLCSLMQTLLGVRLPVYQGPSSSFLVPLVVISTSPEWICVSPDLPYDQANLSTTGTPLNPVVYDQGQKLRKLSGSLMAASVAEVLVGFFGVVGVLMRFIGPVTIGPTIALIGLSLIRIPIIYGQSYWPLAATSCVLTLLFSLVLNRVRVPVPSMARCRKKPSATRSIPIFQLIPILLAMAATWAVAAILTSANVFSSDPEALEYLARTDAKVDVIKNTPWFIFPYPGQFGMPDFSAAVFVGFLAATVTSVIESVGDYFATARACQVPPPPREAVTRGILVEGLGSFLSGAVGAGHATTSYSVNVAIVSLTQTASRSVLVCAGLIQMALSLVGKFGAALATVPNPILGGIQFAVLGMLISIGVSTLSQVNMAASRNLVIVGFAFLLGLALPMYMEDHPDIIDTGNSEVDQVLQVLLKTPMFLGGVSACLLDNLVRGTPEERGMAARPDLETAGMASEEGTLTEEVVYGSAFVKKCQNALPCLRYLPFLPRYRSSVVDYTQTDVERQNV